MDIEDFGKTGFKHNTKESSMIPDKMPSQMTKAEVEKYFPKRGLFKPQEGDYLRTGDMTHTDFLRAVDAFQEQGVKIINCVFDKSLNTLVWAENGLHHICDEGDWVFPGRDLTKTVGRSCQSENFSFTDCPEMELFTWDFFNYGTGDISEDDMFVWTVQEGRILYNPYTDRLVWAKKWKDEPIPENAADIENGLVKPGLDFIIALNIYNKLKLQELSESSYDQG